MENAGSKREKLGLCLAGGGFRASLFHLGVLRRMAELDLLRYVEVLSTVSGGSITGALYALLLKKNIDEHARLTRDRYVDIVKELHGILTGAIQKNLRTRLFMNPWWTLRVMLTSESLGRSMSRLYGKHIYSRVVKDIKGLRLDDSDIEWGRIRLNDILMTPGGKRVTGGLEEYNRKAVEDGESGGAVVTKLVLNATSLNSGRPFVFSGIEIGDECLGFFRRDELEELLKRKRLLHEYGRRELEESLAKRSEGMMSVKGKTYDARPASLALWWIKSRTKDGKDYIPEDWKDLFKDGFPGRLRDVEFGLLRKIKLSAWYLRKGIGLGISGGRTEAEHLERFWNDMDDCDNVLAELLKQRTGQDGGLMALLLDFVLELYYLRSAEVMDWNIEKSWDHLTLAEAVGASACFPPVFPPFIIPDIYDDLHVTRLGLTDGGVYDNVGLMSLLEEDCTHIIASDTSGLFDTQKQSTEGRVGMMGRIVSILMDDVAAQQRQRVRELKKCDKLEGLSFFHIKSTPKGNSLELPFDRREAAALRTDLDGFGEVEIAALVDQGYDTADEYLHAYFTDTVYANKCGEHWRTPAKAPIPIERDRGDVGEILEAGRSRFFRIFKLRPIISYGVAALIAALAIWAAWGTTFTLREIGNFLINKLLNWIETSVPVVGKLLVSSKLSIGIVLIAVIAVAILWLLWKRIKDALKDEHFRILRALLKIGKRLRTHWGYALFPIGYLPLVISVGGAVLAWISFVCFHLPFMAAARNRKKG